MSDQVFLSFLMRQYEEGMELSRNSDLVKVLPLDDPPRCYLVAFECRGLVRSGDEVVETGGARVAISFPRDYLQRAEPSQVVTWLGPREIWHPNILPPMICVGRLAPGTGLVDIVHQIFEIITYQRVTMREDDALNRPACQWARANRHRFPADPRPLKRRSLALDVIELEAQP